MFVLKCNICLLIDTNSSDSDVQSFMKEALVMKEFSHPNVLGLTGVCIGDKMPMLVVPFMSKGDLRGFLLNQKMVCDGTCYLRNIL